MTSSNNSTKARFYSGDKVAPFPMNYTGLNAPGRTTELATIDAINRYYAQSISYESAIETLRAAGVTEASISDHLSNETEERLTAVAPEIPENYLSDYDANSASIILPEIFSGIVGRRSDYSRSTIRALISRLSKGELSAEVFVKKASDVCNLDFNELKAFAQSIVAALPPKLIEPEIEPYVSPKAVEPEPDPVVPIRLPDWIKNLPLDRYVKNPGLAGHEKEITNALFLYCQRGISRAESVTERIKRVTFSQCWDSIDSWFSKIDDDRKEFITDRKIKVEREEAAKRLNQEAKKQAALVKVNQEFNRSTGALENQLKTKAITADEFNKQWEHAEFMLEKFKKEIESE